MTLREVAGLMKRFGGLATGTLQEYRKIMEWREASIDSHAYMYKKLLVAMTNCTNEFLPVAYAD